MTTTPAAEPRLPEFTPFPSLSRLYRGCVITEKIDGTNAQIYVPEDPAEPLLAGSRSRWLTAGGTGDNFGFGAWVAAHADELRAGLGPGRHFGEWWGSGIQRRYGLTGEDKRFSLFNTGRWAPFLAHPDQVAGLLARFQAQEPGLIGTATPPACCHVVPVLFAGTFSDAIVRAALDHLAANGSVAAPGFTKPEGVVVYHAASRESFKVTLDGDGHKGAKR